MVISYHHIVGFWLKGRQLLTRLLNQINPIADPLQSLLQNRGFLGIARNIRDRTRTLKAVLENADLDQASVSALFRSARGIQSSGDKARLLVAAAPHFMNDAAQRATFFEAVGTIDSSGDHARVLLALLSENQLNNASILAVLESAEAISSSGDKTRVLVKAAGLVASDDDLVAAYLDAAETISSSGDHTRALSALVRAVTHIWVLYQIRLITSGMTARQFV